MRFLTRVLPPALSVLIAIGVIGTVPAAATTTANPVTAAASAVAVAATPPPVATPVTPGAAKILAGSFGWDATITCCLNSRKWTQAGGSTRITSYGDCGGAINLKSYAIELYRDEIVDDSYGRVSFACNQNLQYTWTSLPSGTYYFRITKQSDTTVLTASGSVFYP